MAEFDEGAVTVRETQLCGPCFKILRYVDWKRFIDPPGKSWSRFGTGRIALLADSVPERGPQLETSSDALCGVTVP